MKRHETRLLFWAIALFAAVLLFLPLGPQQTERVVFRTENLLLDVGQQEYLRYILETDDDETPKFSSSAPLVVSVDQTGLVTGISPGSATITLRAGDALSATAEVSVYGTPVTSIRLDADEITMLKGQRTRLTGILNEGATDTRIFWSSDDTSIVQVGADGLIEAVGGGTAHVRATTVNAMTTEATVHVEVPLTDVSVSPSELVVGVGARIDLNVDMTPPDTTETVAAWESTDTNVIQVDDSGQMRAVGIGTARVRLVMTNALAAYADVAVQQTAEGVEILPASATVNRGGEILLTARISPEKSMAHHVLWTSDSPEIASVQDGVVRGLMPGTAQITAIVDGVRSREACKITVQALPQILRLNVNELTLTTAEAEQPVRLRAEVLPADAEQRSVTYTSDNTDVADVDASGIVRFAGSPGIAHITAATESGLTDTCSIYINP